MLIDGATKYTNLLKYTRRAGVKHKFAKKWAKDNGETFIKWYNKHSADMINPTLTKVNPSDPLIYSPKYYIVLDAKFDEEKLLSMLSRTDNKVYHDPISNRYGNPDVRTKTFVSFDTKAEAINHKMKKVISLIDERIEQDPTFKIRRDKYLDMVNND